MHAAAFLLWRLAFMQPAFSQEVNHSSAEDECAAFSGVRAGFIIGAAPNATTVSGLGALSCDTRVGYVRTNAAGICDTSAFGVAPVNSCPWYRLCDAASCNAVHSLVNWVFTNEPFAECESGFFEFSGCGCPAGKYLNISFEPQLYTAEGGQNTDMSKCMQCPAGTVSRVGATSPAQCEPCAPGQYDHDIDPLTPCIDCAAGSFSTGPLSCTECPADTFSATGATSCHPCPPDRVAGPQSDELSDCNCRSGLYPVSERTVSALCVAVDAAACGQVWLPGWNLVFRQVAPAAENQADIDGPYPTVSEWKARNIGYRDSQRFSMLALLESAGDLRCAPKMMHFLSLRARSRVPTPSRLAACIIIIISLYTGPNKICLTLNFTSSEAPWTGSTVSSLPGREQTERVNGNNPPTRCHRWRLVATKRSIAGISVDLAATRSAIQFCTTRGKTISALVHTWKMMPKSCLSSCLRMR